MPEETTPQPGRESQIDRVVEWRRLAGSYPRATLAVAAAGGFWIGRRHGRELLRAASDFLSREMTRNVQGIFDGLTGEPERSPGATPKADA